MKECSELASVKTYKPFDIVYVADQEQINPVHIILSGRCSIIQYLNMNVSIVISRIFTYKIIFRVFI